MGFSIHSLQIDISEGQTLRMDCPFCKGRNTFTVSQIDGTVMYNCYRADCGKRGAYKTRLTAEDIRKRFKPQEQSDDPDYVMELPITLSFDLGNKDLMAFIDKWTLTEVPMLYDIAQHRAVFPVYNKRGRLIDAVGRTLRGDTPKWLRYGTHADYYAYGSGHVAVVVEDCISAIAAAKCDKNVTGIAILGTSMNAKHIDKLSQYDKIIVALDPDAAKKSVAYALQLKGHGLDAVAMRLTDDLKYRTTMDIQQLKELTDAIPRNAKLDAAFGTSQNPTET